MTGSPYWERWNKRVLGRRAILRGSLTAAVAGGAVALVGCGSGSSSNTTPSGKTTATTSTAGGSVDTTGTIAKAKPGDQVPYEADTFFATKNQKSGGTFHYNTEYSGFSADPDNAYQGDYIMLRMVYQNLYQLTWPSAATALYVAKSIEQADPLSWVVNIRDGVKFHPKPPANGRAVTADDVKYSFDRTLADKTSQYSGGNSFIDKVEVVSPTSVKFTSKAPYSSRFDNISPVIMPQGLVETLGSRMAKTGVGTGPYMFDDDYNPAGLNTFSKHPDFMVPGRPFPDKVEFRHMTDQSAQEAAFRSGQIDMVGRALQKPTAEALASAGGTVVHDPFLAQYYLATHPSAKPFDDIRVRQAVSLAVDRKSLIQKVEFGQGQADGTLPYGLTPWVLPQSEIDQFYKVDSYSQNLAQAKQLLSAVGGSAIGQVEFTYPSDIPALASGGALIAGMLRNAGFDIKENPQLLTSIVQSYLFTGKFQLLYMQTGTQENPMSYFQNLGSSPAIPGAAPYFGSKDNDIDTAILAILSEFNFDARVEKGKALQRLALQKYWNAIGVYSPEAFYVQKSYLKDYRPNLILSTYMQSDYWLDK